MISCSVQISSMSRSQRECENVTNCLRAHTQKKTTKNQQQWLTMPIVALLHNKADFSTQKNLGRFLVLESGLVCLKLY